LFADGDLRNWLDQQRRALSERAAAIAPEHALARSVDELSAELADAFQVEPLVVHWDATNISLADARVDVSQRQDRIITDRGRPFYVAGTTVSYHVPFAGDANLFKLRPSTFSSVFPVAAVTGSELALSATFPVPVPNNVANEFDREIARIRQYVDWVNGDVAEFNADLEKLATSAVKARRDKVLADQQLMASIGLPLRRNPDARPTYAAPSVRRKTVTQGHRSGRASQRPEPVLPAEEYEHVLAVVRGMVHVMERSPKAFVDMSEEEGSAQSAPHARVRARRRYRASWVGTTGWLPRAGRCVVLRCGSGRL